MTNSPLHTAADTSDTKVVMKGSVFDYTSRMCSRHAPCRTGVDAGEIKDGCDV